MSSKKTITEDNFSMFDVGKVIFQNVPKAERKYYKVLKVYRSLGGVWRYEIQETEEDGSGSGGEIKIISQDEVLSKPPGPPGWFENYIPKKKVDPVYESVLRRGADENRSRVTSDGGSKRRKNKRTSKKKSKRTMRKKMHRRRRSTKKY